MGHRLAALALLALSPMSWAWDPNPAGASAQPDGPALAVGVRYLTNRSVAGTGPEGVAYGDDRGTPRYGRYQVQFTSIPLLGDLAPSIPFYVPAETKRVRTTVPLLSQTLVELDRRIGWPRTQVLAHSLGTRGVVHALEWLGNPPGEPLRDLVLLAPDFDAQTFPAHLPRPSAPPGPPDPGHHRLCLGERRPPQGVAAGARGPPARSGRGAAQRGGRGRDHRRLAHRHDIARRIDREGERVSRAPHRRAGGPRLAPLSVVYEGSMGP